MEFSPQQSGVPGVGRVRLLSERVPAVSFQNLVKRLRSSRVPRLGEQSPSSPRRRRLGVRHASTFFWGGRSYSAVPHGVSGAGGFLSLVRKAGRWRGPGTAVGGSDSGRVSGPSRGSPQLRRPLGEPSVRAGGPFRRCASAGA
ncbi:unnamed protein product [Pleuronectes platessa]|uniref:Uncharacterized protein n=1 Tax=Pleuronectes platessa TaxID=8262 RepID=A0A9N7VPV4_PLEPL|nr:unnamed protein product [Pleuronectes platessa]